MRILQIIDSLEAGGAEKMAVNYANVLSKRIDFSGIVVTRKEGNLKSQIKQEVGYFFLNKKRAFDFKAIIKLKQYIKNNKVEVIHAHGTSFFTAFLLKIVAPKIKIIFHEHYGNRSNQSQSENIILRISSFFFSGIIVVNHLLEDWFISVFNFKKVLYLPNFILLDKIEKKETILKGVNGKRILCLANLKKPKNHNLIIPVAIKLKKTHPEWTFHLIGENFRDNYSNELIESIRKNNLDNVIYIYGLKDDTSNIIQQSSICILTSISEGLPIALLEYGLEKKAVVCTNVGEIPLILTNNVNGFVVDSNDSELFSEALLKLINNESMRMNFGEQLFKTIIDKHTENAIITQYLNWVATL